MTHCNACGRKSHGAPEWMPDTSSIDLQFCSCGCKARTVDRQVRYWKCAAYQEIRARVKGH
jgi:hypothetical protein